jgi:hypothetical protein
MFDHPSSTEINYQWNLLIEKTRMWAKQKRCHEKWKIGRLFELAS